jgi:hypothetical protein
MENLEQAMNGTIASMEGRYVFPAYWGGMVVSSKPPQIHAKLRELRQAVGGLKAKKVQGGPMFPVRGAKELAQKLAQALNDLDMVAPVIAQEVTLVDTDKIPSNATSSGKPVFRTLAHVKSTVRVGAPDGSYVDMVGSGHGGDVDDKAGGKADTYGWKIAILKGLTIPEEDMIDTDDDSSDRPDPRAARNTSATKPAPVQDGVPARGKVESAAPDLNDIILRIAAADEAALTEIKAEAKANFSGAELLKISTAFVKRRDELNKQAKADKAEKESK